MYKNWTLNNNKISIFELEQGIFKTFQGTIINVTDINGNLQTFSNLLYLKEYDSIVQELPLVSDILQDYRTYFVQNQSNITQVYKFNSSSIMLQLIQGDQERYFLIRDEVGYSYLDYISNYKFFIDSNLNLDRYYGFVWRDAKQQKYLVFESSQKIAIYDFNGNLIKSSDEIKQDGGCFQYVDDNIGIFTDYKSVNIVDLLNFNALFSCNFTNAQFTKPLTWLGRDQQLKIEILYNFYQIVFVNYQQQSCNIFNLPVQQYKPTLFMDSDHKLLIIEYEYQSNILIFQYPSMTIQYNFNRQGSVDNFLNFKTIQMYYSKSLSNFYYTFNDQLSDNTSLLQKIKMIDISQVNYIHEFKNKLSFYTIDNENLYIINQNIKTLNVISLQNHQIVNYQKLRSSAKIDDVDIFQLASINNNQLIAISYDIYYIIEKSNLLIGQTQQMQNNQIILTYNSQYVFTVKLNDQNIYELNIFNSKTLAFQTILSLNIQGPDYIEAKVIEINPQFIGFRIDSLQDIGQQYLLFDLINLEIISQISMNGIKSLISCYNDDSVLVIVRSVNQNYQIEVFKIVYVNTNYQIYTIQKIVCTQSCFVDSLFQENNQYFIILNSGESLSYLFNLSQIQQFNTQSIDPLKQWVRPCQNSKVVLDNQYIYMMCPFKSNIYSLISLRYINEIKSNAFTDSQIDSIHNFDKNFFLVLYNNKIELYEIQKFYKKLIKTIDQIINPILISPPKSVINISDNQTRQISLQILSDYMIFKYSITYTSFQFMPKHYKIQSIDFVQIVINQIEDFQQICAIQTEQNGQNLRYQLFFNTSKILNPFPICNNNFFSRNNVIEYTSSVSSLNLISKSAALKLLQFQNVSFQSDSHYNCLQPLIYLDTHQKVSLFNIQVDLISVEPQTNIIQILLANQVLFNQLVFNFEERQLSENTFRMVQQKTPLYIIQFQGTKQVIIDSLIIHNSKQIGVLQATSLQQDYVIWENLQIILDKITLKNSNQVDTPYLFNIECLNVTLINNYISNINVLNDIYNIQSSNMIEVDSSIFQNIQIGKSSVIHIINNSNRNKNILFYNTSFIGVNSIQTTSSIKVESLYNSAQKVQGLLNITNCTFESNINNGQKNIDYFIQSSFGGSIYVNNFEQVLINDSVFNNNTCFTSGGAILFYSIDKISINNSNFINCKSLYSSGGAIFIDNTNNQYLSSEYNCILNRNRFHENSAIQEKGGALFIKKTNLVLQMNTILNNLAVIGGAIYIDPKYTSEIKKSYNTFTNNQGLLYGNNIGQDPLDIKFVDKSGIPLNQNLFVLDQFQSGNYTKKGVYLQFFDKENKIFKFQDIRNETLSENIQLELKNYTLEVSSLDSKDNISILNGTLLELEQSEIDLFKLNITAAYKNQNTSILTIKAPQFQNISIQFKIEFRSCQIGEIKITRNSYVMCEECGPTTYSLVDPDTQQGQVQCKLCPEEALAQYCYGSHLKLRDGFWRSSVLSDNIYTCKSDGCSETKQNINFCLQGYTGPLCESCDNTGNIWQMQYGKKEDKCLICSDINSVFYNLAIILFVYFFYAQMSIKSQITSKQRVIRLKYLCKLRMVYLNKSIESSKDSSILVKIFLSYIQIFSSCVTVFSNSISELQTVLNVGGDPSQVTAKSYDCITKMSQYYPVWLNRLIFQLLQIFWILLGILMIQKIIAKRKKRKFYSQIYCIFIYLFFFPSLSKMLISLILCQKIEGKLYLLNDYQQECFTKVHLVYSFCIIYPITICWAFVIPFFLYKKMSQHQKQKQTQKINYILSYYFVQQGYKSKYFYWEIVRMLYKLTIMVLINILSQEIRSLLIALVCLFYYILVQSKQPFHSIVYINIEKKLTLILVYSLVLQDCALINGYGKEFYYLAITVILLINLYGLLIVSKLYLEIQRANLSRFQNNTIIKKIFELKFFKKFKPSFVNLLRISSLWKLIHQKLIKDKKQICSNTIIQSIKIEENLKSQQPIKVQSCVSSDLNTVRTQGVLLTIQQALENNLESQQIGEDQVIRFPSSSFSFS
ncbi:transmembrane protein, putative (macronuclear) [Tetrahymena thermophila SB210]|uniref:Transmembrane protein, putative n=1 Tax=Tetrahymena thermophila (strain SB210) TaxID=312017 RepID=Q22UV1_TETTS|nr:transmembrane protein, putative [Tetrahymena thermophila SB210]EAR89025.2 transmembrane protein, putative [Tetrahymena thermophila SB210]|eukprot:XP_001009270.2 transmembrane protein, putative [Tetrahymena thermophila SB210]